MYKIERLEPTYLVINDNEITMVNKGDGTGLFFMSVSDEQDDSGHIFEFEIKEGNIGGNNVQIGLSREDAKALTRYLTFVLQQPVKEN